MRILLAILLLAIVANPLLAAGRPMTVEDLLAVKGVSDPQVSPDGSLVVYVVTELDHVTQKNTSNLWLVPTAGGQPKQLTTATGTNNHPRLDHDGIKSTIAFVSHRGGSAQVWLMPLDGGEARQLTKLPIDVSGPIWSPQGDKIAFVAEVYPGSTPEQTAAKDKEKEASKKKVRIYDRLMIRHWNVWDEGKRSHLFVADAHSGEAHDLTPKLEVNTPPAPFGGSSDYAWSPDGKELAFTAEPSGDAAWSTNTDIWTVPADGGEAKNLTEANKGADAQPAYAPDGRWLAYLSQARPGFESDQWVLTVRDRRTGQLTQPTKALDRPVQSFAWDPSQARHADRSRRSRWNRVDHRLSDQGRWNIRHQPGDHAKRTDARWRSLGFQCFAQGRLPDFHPQPCSTAGRARTRRVRFRAGQLQCDPPRYSWLTHHNDQLTADLDLQAAESFESSLEPTATGFKAGWSARRDLTPAKNILLFS